MHFQLGSVRKAFFGCPHFAVGSSAPLTSIDIFAAIHPAKVKESEQLREGHYELLQFNSHQGAGAPKTKR